jgi:hypothetical protein
MNLSDELSRLQTVFIDKAPIIYYTEAHPQFGPLAKEVVDSFRSGKLSEKYTLYPACPVELLPW